jgi:hypothetical protein
MHVRRDGLTECDLIPNDQQIGLADSIILRMLRCLGCEHVNIARHALEMENGLYLFLECKPYTFH